MSAVWQQQSEQSFSYTQHCCEAVPHQHAAPQAAPSCAQQNTPALARSRAGQLLASGARTKATCSSAAATAGRHTPSSQHTRRRAGGGLRMHLSTRQDSSNVPAVDRHPTINDAAAATGCMLRPARHQQPHPRNPPTRQSRARSPQPPLAGGRCCAHAQRGACWRMLLLDRGVLSTRLQPAKQQHTQGWDRAARQRRGVAVDGSCTPSQLQLSCMAPVQLTCPQHRPRWPSSLLLQLPSPAWPWHRAHAAA